MPLCPVWSDSAKGAQKALGINNKATAIAISEMSSGSFSGTEASWLGMAYCYFIKLSWFPNYEAPSKLFVRNEPH